MSIQEKEGGSKDKKIGWRGDKTRQRGRERKGKKDRQKV